MPTSSPPQCDLRCLPCVLSLIRFILFGFCLMRGEQATVGVVAGVTHFGLAGVQPEVWGQVQRWFRDAITTTS
jgi:hypothetical protein